MKKVDIAIIGGGPAGLCAAISAASSGASVLLIDRNKMLGGQLIKQTHMFFGSEKQYASTRGIDIVDILIEEIKSLNNNIEIYTNAIVLGIYEDKVITVLSEGKYEKIKPKAIIVATGASEKVLAFPNNDLPGIYGAGAVQTLMNVYGIKPGKKVIMVGAGNIGLIVSYQLIQAGVDVLAVLEASPSIGGYLVHASKLTRIGVPIKTRHTIKEAKGNEILEKVIVWELDDNWKGIEGTEKEYDVDVVCISVGLTPLSELLFQAGCQMKYVSELGGNVPIINKNHETSIEQIYACGDVSGIEEASSAMVEGYITGLNAAIKIGYTHEDYKNLSNDYYTQLDILRSGPAGHRIREGVKKVMREASRC